MTQMLRRHAWLLLSIATWTQAQAQTQVQTQAQTQAQTKVPLASWNDGPSKKAIVDFVARVTDKSSPDFVPIADRLATSGNDGTLRCEQPLYFQFLFALDRVKATAPEHPEWKEKEPFKSILAGDTKAVLAGGEKGIMEIIAATHTGMTVEEFDGIAR